MIRCAVLKVIPGPVVNVIYVSDPADYVHPEEGCTIVANATVHPDDFFDGTVFTTPATPVDPAGLTGHAKRRYVELLAAGQHFNVAPAGQAPTLILCDGNPDTTNDLGALWRFGVGNASATREWVDNDGVKTVLTGIQFVMLDTLVSAWRSSMVGFLDDLSRQILAGAVSTFDEIDALAWPAA